MLNINLEVLEKYVMNNDKSKVLEFVTPFSEQYYFIELMTEINVSQNMQTLKQKVTEFHENKSYNIMNRNIIKIKYLLSVLDGEPSENEQQQTIQELNNLYLKIDFNHTKPQKIEMKNNLITEDNKIPSSKIDKNQEAQLTNKYYINEYYQNSNINNLKKIKNESLYTLDLNIIKTKNLQTVKDLLNLDVQWFKSKQIVSFLKEISLYQSNLLKSYFTRVCFKLSLNQLEELMTEDYFLNFEEVFKFYFTLKFNQEVKLSKHKERDKLLSILDFFENKPIKYKQASASFRRKLLKLNYDLNIIDEKELIKYLENPHSKDIILLKTDYQKTLLDYNSRNHCTDLNSPFIPDSELIKNILNQVFQNSDGYKTYLKYFDEKNLHAIYFSNKLMQGLQISNINNIFSDSQLKEMNKKKILSLERNKENFGSDEKVELTLQLKNIKTLKIKVFEVNTEAFLIQNNSNDYKNIKIESITPFEEYFYNYNQSPLIIHNEKLEFSSITNKKRGVFIIDLIGEEINSRAIIYKGNLTLLFDKLTGRNCIILDENNNLCKSNRTGLYLGNKFFKANEENGVINIPFNVSSDNNDVIVVHDDFANLSKLKLNDLNFRLESNFIYNSESLMPGLKTKLLLKNILFCNNKKIELNLLKNVEVTILTTNMAGVEQTQILRNHRLSDDEDLELNFLVPSKMKNLNINIKSHLEVNGKIENISSNVFLDFQRSRMKQKIDSALKKNKEKEYILELFGINGEIIPEEKVVAIFRFSKNTQTIHFITDSKGRINMGRLKEVSEIDIKIKNLTFNFKINVSTKDHCYPENIHITENENIYFPVKIADSKNIFLFKYQSYIHSHDFSNKVLIQDNLLTIELLEFGKYKLYVNDFLINIEVHKGIKKNLNGINIMNDDYILGLQAKSNYLIGKVQQDEINYILDLEGDLENVRIHLLSSNYKEEFFSGDIFKNNIEDNLIFEKIKQRNDYLSEGKLSDELNYVYNRSSKNTYLGNTLDKPGILLKRNKINITKEEKEKLSKGINQKCKKKKKKKFNQYSNKANATANKITSSKQILLKEFFKYPGQIISNLKPESNKILIKKEDFKNQSFIYALVITTNASIFLEIDTNDVETEKVDLRLEDSRKTGFIYRYERSMNFLKEGVSFNISHADKKEYCFIEDIKDLFNAIKIIGANLTNFDDWRFLSEWDSLSVEDKLRNYDKKYSNEINIFLKLKDKVFFEEVIKVFIMNKKEKTLVDFYLLDDVERLKSFCIFSNFIDLTPLECVLLIDGLKHKYRHLSQRLLNYLEMKSKLIHRKEEQTKKKFDSLLSSNKKEEDKEEENLTCQISNNQNKVNQIQMEFETEAPTFHRGNYKLIGCFRRRIETLSLKKKEKKTRNNKEDTKEEKEEEEGEEDEEEKDDENLNELAQLELKANSLNLNRMNFAIQNKHPHQEIFTALQGTVEYNEKKYYYRYLNNLNTVEKYWFELSSYILEHNSITNFFSESFIYSCDHPTEAIAVLGFIDLPFKKKTLPSKLENNTLNLLPQSNIICLTKEIIQNEAEQGDIQVMIGQRFFDPNDKYKVNEIENTQYEKPVKEFIKGVIYESNIVVTNSSSSSLTVDLISEIPQGSISFYSLDSINVQKITLDSLKSNSYSFHFYFPESGSYSVFPATVVKDNYILGFSQIKEVIKVMDYKTLTDMDTISDILSTGNIESILKFVETKNVLNAKLFNFNDIYWLLKLKPFYEGLICLLKSKGVFDYTVWSYSIYHNDFKSLQEFLSNKIAQNKLSILKYSNKVVHIDRFEIKEYYPLVNPRVHSLNQNNNNNILNISFKNTYTEFLSYLFQKGTISIEDKLLLINYLICQDRIEEAIKYYDFITKEEVQNLDCKIQFDYLSAYLDFINGYPNFTRAKEICKEYLSFPVLTWRNLFVEIANQLAEFEETKLIYDIIENEEFKKANKEKAKIQASFNCELTKEVIKIMHENLSSVIIKFYKINLEVYFSMNTFNNFSIKEYTLIKPFSEDIVELVNELGLPYYLYKIPNEISKENLFIEISSKEEGLNKSQYLEYIPFYLNYHVNKEFGVIKLFDEETRKSVPKVYMKCFAKYKNNEIKFYKDGYSDLRGSFDYLSLNKDNLDDISLFRILIVSEFGCKIIETEPPVKIGTFEGEAKKLISKNWVKIQKTNGMSKKEGNIYQKVYF